MKVILLFFALGGLTMSAVAQHQHTGSSKADTTSASKSSMDGMNHADMGSHQGHMMNGDSMMPMTHSLSRYLPMSRNGSGTSWHPDQTPMYANMKHTRSWSYMLHYAVYLRYTSQNMGAGDRRGKGQQFGAPNWVMGMAQRTVGRRGLFQARAMLSLDPLTVGLGGYPLLFQTGETYRGRPLIDRQHPHDLFSELSVSYAHAISQDIDLYGYVGYPGEPALGPPAFMHRISAFGIPDAPLSHHWQDASHIVFGVATAGVRYKWLKLEGSSFTGREPDEHRYGFDRPRFDSYSYRLSVNPARSLALQFSQGYLHDPEESHPGENVTRTTASVLHSLDLGPGRYVTSALVWGQNRHHDDRSNSYLAESSLQLNRTAVYGRFEHVSKTADELGLEQLNILPDDLQTVNALTLGANYRVAQQRSTDLVLGVQLTGYAIDPVLRPFYGQSPVSGQIYLRLSPSLMRMNQPGHAGGRHASGRRANGHHSH